MTRIITISEDITQEIAEKVVEQASAGYSTDAQGAWYVVDGERVMHKQPGAAWAPWNDSADVISVEDLVFWAGGAEDDRAGFENDGSEADVEAAVDFALSYVPGSYDADAYEAMYG